MDLQALWKVSYGLYVVSARKNGKSNGQIANTVFQLSAEPATMGVCINKLNLTHEYIAVSGTFSISILEQETPFPFIGVFGFRSGRDIDKFANTVHKTGLTGAPILIEHAVAYLECRVTATLDAGTHTLFVGPVVDAVVLNDKTPLTYDYYHRVLKGKAPKTATTYIDDQHLKNTREASL